MGSSSKRFGSVFCRLYVISVLFAVKKRLLIHWVGLLQTIIYCPILYWLTGLSPAQDGVHFVMYLFVVFISALVGAAWVRLIVSVSGTREGATGLAGHLPSWKPLWNERLPLYFGLTHLCTTRCVFLHRVRIRTVTLSDISTPFEKDARRFSVSVLMVFTAPKQGLLSSQRNTWTQLNAFYCPSWHRKLQIHVLGQLSFAVW